MRAAKNAAGADLGHEDHLAANRGLQKADCRHDGVEHDREQSNHFGAEERGGSAGC
jgi:hypothetical protein